VAAALADAAGWRDGRHLWPICMNCLAMPGDDGRCPEHAADAERASAYRALAGWIAEAARCGHCGGTGPARA
jgi:hypothetical protein